MHEKRKKNKTKRHIKKQNKKQDPNIQKRTKHML